MECFYDGALCNTCECLYNNLYDADEIIKALNEAGENIPTTLYSKIKQNILTDLDESLKSLEKILHDLSGNKFVSVINSCIVE